MRVLVLSCVAFFAATAVALASRAPTHAERARILHAAHTQANGPGCRGYPRGHCRERVRVSTARGTWAAVYLEPSSHRYVNEVQPDVASLHRRHGRWYLHQEGNGGGCGVPVSVRRDLKLACF